MGLFSSSTVTVDDFDLDRRHAGDCPSCFTWCAHCRDGAIPNCLKIEVAGLADRADAGWPSNAGHNDFWPTCTVCDCFNGVYYGQWYYDYLNTTRCGVYLSWYNCYLTTTVEGYGANRRLTVNVVKENDIYYLRGQIEYETVRWEKELGTELPDCRAFDNEVLTLVNPGGNDRMCDYVGSTLTVSSVSSGCPTPVRIMCPAVCIDCYNAPEELEIVIGGPLRTRDGASFPCDYAGVYIVRRYGPVQDGSGLHDCYNYSYTSGWFSVSFRQACMNRFEACGIVSCQHRTLWRTADEYQKDMWPACPVGGSSAAVRGVAADL